MKVKMTSLEANNKETEVKLQSVEQQNKDLWKDVAMLNLQLSREKQVHLSIKSNPCTLIFEDELAWCWHFESIHHLQSKVWVPIPERVFQAKRIEGQKVKKMNIFFVFQKSDEFITSTVKQLKVNFTIFFYSKFMNFRWKVLQE